MKVCEQWCEINIFDSTFFRKMVDTVHVTRNIERNATLGISDFYLAVDAGNSPSFAGSMALEEAVKVIDNMIITRDSLVIGKWFPTSAPPSFPMDLGQLFKNPVLMRNTAVKFCKWLRQDLSLGDGKLLGWSYPVERDLFVLTDRLMPGITSTTFSLSSLIAWLSMTQLTNGFSSGNTRLLEAGTGITSWLNFLKIFLEVKIITSNSHLGGYGRDEHDLNSKPI